MKQLANLLALSFAVIVGAAKAETWPTLPQYVDSSVLIVLCRTERSKDGLRYKVEETWKGVYSPALFYHTPEEGYLYTGSWHGNEGQKEGVQTVFFFTAGNHPSWTKGKLLDHSTSFQVADGKLIYASTSDSGFRKEYTLSDFRKAIAERVRQHFADELKEQIQSNR